MSRSRFAHQPVLLSDAELHDAITPHATVGTAQYARLRRSVWARPPPPVTATLEHTRRRRQSEGLALSFSRPPPTTSPVFRGSSAHWQPPGGQLQSILLQLVISGIDPHQMEAETTSRAASLLMSGWESSVASSGAGSSVWGWSRVIAPVAAAGGGAP